MMRETTLCLPFLLSDVRNNKMINGADLAWNEILFVHFDEQTQAEICICVSRLLKDRKVKLLRTIDIAIDPEWGNYCIENRGIEKHRLERCLALNGNYAEPILYAHWGDGSKLHLDGVHRYVAAWINGFTSIKAKVVPVTLWRQYVVTGLRPSEPVKLRDSFSGLL